LPHIVTFPILSWS